MSFTNLNTDLLLFSKDDKWNNSVESITIQKITKLSKSESVFQIPPKLDPDLISELELGEFSPRDSKSKTECEFTRKKPRFPKVIQTKSLLRNELEILKINMSTQEKLYTLSDSQMLKEAKKKSKRYRSKKFIKNWCKPSAEQKVTHPRKSDLITAIEGSDSVKTDATVWKFLQRGSDLRKYFTTTTGSKFLLDIQAKHLSAYIIQNTQPATVTCPNCRFFVTTDVKRVSTLRTQLASIVLAFFGYCLIPQILHALKETVHLCPLCKIYLGFCPAFGIRNKIRVSKLFSRTTEKVHVNQESNKILNRKMVSASSTSAKNLFVESKLRLSDRVQVNVNNIATIARQIQRGSKSNEYLITAAKNFALQEAAIENSETNLKKLKLLSTHLNNQVDSLHNSCSKMEVVLEQVRSMQR